MQLLYDKKKTERGPDLGWWWWWGFQPKACCHKKLLEPNSTTPVPQLGSFAPQLLGRKQSKEVTTASYLLILHDKQKKTPSKRGERPGKPCFRVTCSSYQPPFCLALTANLSFIHATVAAESQRVGLPAPVVASPTGPENYPTGLRADWRARPMVGLRT